MEEQVARLLKNSSGPRSTKEVAKGCRVSPEEATRSCNILCQESRIVKIAENMWCINPKFGSSTGGDGSNSSFSRRPPSRPLPSSGSYKPRLPAQRPSFPAPSATKPAQPANMPALYRPPRIQPEQYTPPPSPQQIRPPPSLGRPVSRPPPGRHMPPRAIPPRPVSTLPAARGPSRFGAPRRLPPPPPPNNNSSYSAIKPEVKLPTGAAPCSMHPSRSADMAEDIANDEGLGSMSGSEKVVYEKIKSNNTPWTLRQLKLGGSYNASSAVISSLVEKKFILKIDMGRDDPMYAINPKQLTSARPQARMSSLKRPLPPASTAGYGPPQAKKAAGYGPPQVSRAPGFGAPQASRAPGFGAPQASRAPIPVMSAKISNKIAHDSINKNPVSAIIEFGQALGWPVAFNISRTSGPPNRKKYHMRLTMGERSFDSVATSKKIAKQNVAELGLRILHSENSSGGGVSSVGQGGVVDVTQGKSARDPVIGTSLVGQFEPASPNGIQGTGFFGKAGRFSYDTYNRLASTVQVSTVGRKVIAVFFIEDSRRGAPLWSALSLGTGNRTVDGNNINFEGKTVNDSHAEIVARRGFRRFLWRQLRVVEGKEENTLPFEAVLTKSSSAAKYGFARGVKVHLFISTAPCGDSAIFPISEATQSNEHDTQHYPTMENEKQGLLRSKMESGQGTNPALASEDPLTIDGLMMGDQRLKTMSCSDKVSRWSVLGLQGCLLSEYMDPVYLSSLTLGCLYHHGHLSRAICCRYSGILLPLPYSLHHPLLGCVPGQEAERELGKTSEVSMNWSLGDERVEVLDGCRGRCAKGVTSRIARVAILAEYREFTGLECKDYNKEKDKMGAYVEAKEAYNKFVKEKKYGRWISKPIY